MLVDGRWRLSRPCGEPPINFTPAIDVIGPIAFVYAQTARGIRVAERPRHG
jgi:hypothetical protein